VFDDCGRGWRRLYFLNFSRFGSCGNRRCALDGFWPPLQWRSLNHGLEFGFPIALTLAIAAAVVGVPVRTPLGSTNGPVRDEAATKFERNVLVDRAGVRLFLLHAQLGQHVEDDARFHFKLPRQLIDPDFLHRRDC
jgi:hypothetical protein